MLGTGTLASLPVLRQYASHRASSYNVDGTNEDWWSIPAGSTRTLLASDGPGCIRHIWMTADKGGLWPRDVILRMFWDGEPTPSVEVPLGDFFGIGHGITKNFVSLPFQMSPQDGKGMNSWWSMPFESARIEVENQAVEDLSLYFYIDYESYAQRLHETVARFHAQWRRENPTAGWLTEKLGPENVWTFFRHPNLSDEGNYTILDAVGNGIYVGCHLNIDCYHRQGNDWYGEGDDMIVIDGEPWPPRLHGTGTEDYFGTAWGPAQEFCGPYHGLHLWSGTQDWRWKGKNSMYRYHIEDPIRFERSIRVSIEHGHANKLSNDYSSVAYWYQTEPHGPYPAMLPRELRQPRPNEPSFP